MKMSLGTMGLVFMLLVAGCQTAPKAADAAKGTPTPTPTVQPSQVPTSPDSVQGTKDGFSPLAEAPADTLLLELHWQNPAEVSGWSVQIVGETGSVTREIKGTTAVPNTVWDGHDNAGNLAAQGKYHAVLQIAGADGTLTKKAESASFFVDIVPPSGTVDVSPSPFQPGPAGEIVNPSSLVTMKLNITAGGAAWSTWRLKVIDPKGTVFRGDFINENYKDQTVSWDGRALNNARLAGDTTYNLVAEVFDVYGNKGTLTGSLPVVAPALVSAPAPMVVTLDGKKMADLLIYFPPFSADLDGVSLDRKVKNRASLDQLARLLKDSSGTKVTVVGNANKIFYDDKVKGDWEQAHTLVPLSVARAEAVKTALVAEGIADRVLLTKGVGATNPLAPFDDATNRWKNRRVDIELQTE